jgi:short chain dehydrogenase
MTTSKRRVRGSVAAVTGSARGVGRATAQALAASGAHVAVAGIDGDLPRTVTRGLGHHCAGFDVDVTSSSFKDPSRRIHFVFELPTSGVGKIIKPPLGEMYSVPTAMSAEESGNERMPMRQSRNRSASSDRHR